MHGRLPNFPSIWYLKISYSWLYVITIKDSLEDIRQTDHEERGLSKQFVLLLTIAHTWTVSLLYYPPSSDEKRALKLRAHNVHFGKPGHIHWLDYYTTPIYIFSHSLSHTLNIALYLYNSSYVLPHMRILAHTRMGYPVSVWDKIMSHTRMGVPYEYACMIIHSYTTCTPGINFCLLSKY